ncbi:MAG: hydrogenase iron-sulfur subunit [Rhodospirillaceae bacterium]|jgi:quinol-cytochrome oxidoreductase complex cytochrome b subunit/coenzyme F420-reducing hydrogenase delta subunit|nr:hydrogenase iron-sulfur subunit [Rhodospirillaceae bacterium]
MNPARAVLCAGFGRAESLLDRAFGSDSNPLHNLGALGFLFLWVVLISGIYLYIFFDTSVTGAYSSVEELTHGQWYLGGVMRSLHRYASDGLVLAMLLHLLREFSLDRYRGPRWFSWLTGLPILLFVYAAGVTGYWLVWDQLAQYIAIASSEWLDWLPIFGEPIARNFLTETSLSDRFFTLLVFLHIAVPLFLLLVLWIHLQRVSRPVITPPRRLVIGSLIAMVALSLVKPALSQGPVSMDLVPGTVRLDWFYLALYPLLDQWSAGAVWALVGASTVLLMALPWLPPLRLGAPAAVDLSLCNGCTRCAEDCPYTAIIMRPRSDGRPFDEEAVVDTSLCTRCGICVAACPITTPFRRVGALATAIDRADDDVAILRDRTQRAAEAIAGKPAGRRILVFACAHGAGRRHGEAEGTVRVPCSGAVPPSFIDYALSRGLADGVVIAGCAEGSCHNRHGQAWTEQRIAGTRDPHLRDRVPRDRLRMIWAAPREAGKLDRAIEQFGETITQDADAKAAADD